jgi:hypothetical protein
MTPDLLFQWQFDPYLAMTTTLSHFARMNPHDFILCSHAPFDDQLNFPSHVSQHDNLFNLNFLVESALVISSLRTCFDTLDWLPIYDFRGFLIFHSKKRLLNLYRYSNSNPDGVAGSSSQEWWLGISSSKIIAYWSDSLFYLFRMIPRILCFLVSFYSKIQGHSLICCCFCYRLKTLMIHPSTPLDKDWCWNWLFESYRVLLPQ